jgi:hypothetical protein
MFGIIIVPTIIAKITFLPQKFILAKGYATSDEEINVPKVVNTISKTVFLI